MTALQLLAYIATAIGLQCLLAIAILIWRKRTTVAEHGVPVVSARTSEAAWDGLRAFQVTARTYEDLAHTQCTLALAPVDKVPLPPFKPGQFLTFSLAVDGPDLPTRVTRCYSLSDTPDPDQYRITVKRALEPPNKPDAPARIASGWLHDQVHIGTQPERAVHLFYGVRNSQDHAFKTDLRQLAQAHAGLALHILYADPTAQDVQGQDHDLPGFISLDLLKQTLPHGRHAF